MPKKPSIKKIDTEQIGGDHYHSEDSFSQHWNVMMLLRANYFQGVITKYIDRWRKKNGVEDLQKAMHYARKYKEYLYPPVYNLTSIETIARPLLKKYGMQSLEARAFQAVFQNNMGAAIARIQDLIDDAEAGPTKGYTNQDPS